MPKHKVPLRYGPTSENGERTIYCRICNEAKQTWRMIVNRGSSIPTNICKTCKRARERWHEQGFKCSYEEYERRFAEQKGVCAICARPQQGHLKRLNVDHDHDTKRLRGLLCHNCNVGLGHFGDDVRYLRKAVAYMKRHDALSKHSPESLLGDPSPGNRPPMGRRNTQLKLLA